MHHKVEVALYVLAEKDQGKQYSFRGKGELRCNTFPRENGKTGARLVCIFISSMANLSDDL